MVQGAAVADPAGDAVRPEMQGTAVADPAGHDSPAAALPLPAAPLSVITDMSVNPCQEHEQQLREQRFADQDALDRGYARVLWSVHTHGNDLTNQHAFAELEELIATLTFMRHNKDACTDIKHQIIARHRVWEDAANLRTLAAITMQRRYRLITQGRTIRSFTDLASLGGQGANSVTLAVEALKRAPRSLFLFASDSPVRVAATRIMQHRFFKRAVLCLILLNCITISLYVPCGGKIKACSQEEEEVVKREIVMWADRFFTLTFTGELIVKVVAMGFVMHKGAYLRDAWNVLDFAVVVVGLSSFADKSEGSRLLSVMRCFRVLRPLRTITVIPGMRHVVSTVVASLPLLHNGASCSS